MADTGFVLPTIEEIQARVQADLNDAMAGPDSRIKRAVTYVLSWAMAGVAWCLYQFIGWGVQQYFPDTQDEEYLEAYATQRCGIDRLPAYAVTGYVGVTGTAGSTVTTGADGLMQRADGAEFRTQLEVTWDEDGIEGLPVEAVVAGEDGNTDPSVVVNLASAPSGISTEAYVLPAGLTGGDTTHKARGFIAVQATLGTPTLAAGKQLTIGAVSYQVLRSATWSGLGYRAIEIEALANGTAGNAAGDVAMTWTGGAPAGFSATVRTVAGGLDGGQDEESKAALLARVQQDIRNRPQGGAVEDYRRWVLEAPGSNAYRVWVDASSDPGAVDVWFVTADPADPIPTDDEVANASDYVLDDSRVPVGPLVTVRKPSAQHITLALSIKVEDGADATATKAAIVAELQGLLYDEGEVATAGGTIRNSKLRGAIDRAEGEEYHVLTDVDGAGATADVTWGAGEFPVIEDADITWTVL